VIDQGLEHYIGVFAPGGHPPMIDLMQDPDLGEVLRHFHTEAKRTVALAQLDRTQRVGQGSVRHGSGRAARGERRHQRHSWCYRSSSALASG
jgi:hypothetical protein